MELDDKERGIVRQYLLFCKRYWNEKCYSALSKEFSKSEEDDGITSLTLLCFSNNGYDRNRNYRIISICKRTLTDFLEPVMSAGSRPFSWPDYLEKEIREKINTALQQA